MFQTTNQLRTSNELWGRTYPSIHPFIILPFIHTFICVRTCFVFLNYLSTLSTQIKSIISILSTISIHLLYHISPIYPVRHIRYYPIYIQAIQSVHRSICPWIHLSSVLVSSDVYPGTRQHMLKKTTPSSLVASLLHPLGCSHDPCCWSQLPGSFAWEKLVLFLHPHWRPWMTSHLV